MRCKKLLQNQCARHSISELSRYHIALVSQITQKWTDIHSPFETWLLSMMLSISFLFCLFSLQKSSAFRPLRASYNYGQSLRMNTNDKPVTDKMQATPTAKIVGAALGVLGLVLGKKSIDGPGEYEWFHLRSYFSPWVEGFYWFWLCFLIPSWVLACCVMKVITTRSIVSVYSLVFAYLIPYEMKYSLWGNFIYGGKNCRNHWRKYWFRERNSCKTCCSRC